MARPVTRVLHVEDDQEDFIITQNLLTHSGDLAFEIEWFDRLEPALARLQKGGLDLVLLDLSLPDSTGRETFRRVHECDPQVPVIVLTGLSDEEMALATVKEGAQDYLLKSQLDTDRLTRAARYAIERVRTQNVLQERERHYRKLFEQSNDAVFIHALDGRILDANSRACEMLGYLPAGLKGMQVSSLHPKSLRPATEKALQTTLNRGWAHCESQFLTVAGRTVDVEISFRLIEREKGIIQGIARDITQHKQDESSLTEYRDHLEDLVKRRTAATKRVNLRLKREITEHRKTEVALRNAVKRLEAHDRAKSEFVSNVSHELRTPVASMCYALENMLRGVTGELSDHARSYLTMLQEDAMRLRGTISDILDMSRIDSETLVINRVTLPISILVQRTVKSLNGLASMKQQRLLTDAGRPVGFVSCDPAKMTRVVLNLVGNALKYTPEGGTVEVTLKKDNASGQVVFGVVDDGIGIDSEDLERVTERYFRVGEHVSGTGLGLTLSKELVDLHDGTLSLESPPQGRQKGTAVEVRLPAAQPPSVVVVDDEVTVTRTIERQLGVHGFSVTCCNTGREALKMLEDTRPYLLIVDLIMPGMDGIEIISRVKSAHDLRGMPVLAMTGGELDEVKREVLEGFAIPALAKPWSEGQLMALIMETVLGKNYLAKE